ncbi:MAG: UDP-N-acetylmuramoyl-tripeptide--D-alanyl-D-alanine ligase [Pseudomonadota bacterium]
MNLTLQDIIETTQGRFLKKAACHSRESGNLEGISIDSRTIKPSDLFMAIKGAHFDGNDFIAAVINKGVKAVVIDRELGADQLANIAENVSVIKVNEGTTALGDLAKWWRAKFKATCVAITGSNGKTTTREMVAAIASAKGKVLKTEGNFNNLIGLPLTVFKWTREDQVAVLELGMNAKGEIKRLTEICQPDIGVVTNVTAAHLEKLNTVEGVAKAKAELFEQMSGQGIAIINDEDPWVKKMGKQYSGRTISFGMQNSSDVQFRHSECTDFENVDLTLAVMGEERKIRLPIPGTHNVMNALAAVAVGVALEIKLDEILERLVCFTPVAMRFERVQLANGVCLINDSYNANPLSMKAAFRTVSSVKRAGRFIAVLGDMLELGAQSENLHKEVGQDLVEFGVKKLFTFGERAKQIAQGALEKGLSAKAIQQTQDIKELEKLVDAEIQPGDVLLVKGSRGMHLERLVEYLKHNIGIG